jgi:glycosyltransferase involved in cell wall biosynthesis
MAAVDVPTHWSTPMASNQYLLHPELLESVPFGKLRTAKLLSQRITDTLVDDPRNDPNISLVVRVFNEAAKLEKLFEDIDRQLYSGEVEVIVVDNCSRDRSVEVARAHGAEVVMLPRSEFTYPRSMNLGVEAAGHDLVFLTVAHARLSSNHNLHAGARHFSRSDNTAGAFGTCLPAEGASYLERWAAAGDPTLFLAGPAKPIRKCGLGTLGATGAMISKRIWTELGRFDERYQAGGEDTALAKSMLKAGYRVIQEPAMTVHHSHGLGFKDSVKQYINQLATRAPRRFDEQRVLARRPDLRANKLAADGKGRDSSEP